MKVITISHQKGGVGKTTLTLNIASCLHQIGLKVGVHDTDLQGSLEATKSSFTHIGFITSEEFKNYLSLPYDVILIDTPPYVTDSLSELFHLSDYVLIPTTVGVYDVLAIRVTLQIIRDVQRNNVSLNYGVVLNRVRSGTNLTQDILSMLASYEAHVLHTQIHERVSYARSSLTEGIFGTDDEKAKGEIVSLTEELLKELA